MRITVAIDGPAGAGKSTIAKLVAKEFDLIYINTGSMYRAITLLALTKNIEPFEVEKLQKLLDDTDMYFKKDRLILNGEDVNDELTLPTISNNVSNYAAIKEVRDKLVFLQQKMAQKFNVIMDGRDIGTVVLKDSNFKFYLNATADERAKRRYDELIEKGIEVDYRELLETIIKRDYIDSNREINPLTKAADAIEIDSTNMNIEEVVEFIVKHIKNNINYRM
ncbi:(d)CMP kinase [Clostridium grantii]|uniref:Cytidylate kinase n=1 Tax=Clostridium grantii DSM 8605 TaxID=1121316 RepID=A0A1M5VPP0_9CLOT|nr:(d)CMP kinase [Clostridium grantii]SHH77197.1 cytidylate kinase [Clostridium grantii DSM 8605]